MLCPRAETKSWAHHLQFPADLERERKKKKVAIEVLNLKATNENTQTLQIFLFPRALFFLEGKNVRIQLRSEFFPPLYRKRGRTLLALNFKYQTKMTLQ